MNDLRKEELVGKLKLLRQYHVAYTEGMPLTSDEEFDRLKKETQRLVEIYEKERKIEYEVSTYDDFDDNILLDYYFNDNTNRYLKDKFKICEHVTRVRGIPKSNDYYELTSWLKLFIDKEPDILAEDRASFLVEPKYDGIHITLYYTKGRLRRILTRGDGTQGYDIVGLLSKNKTIPKKIGIIEDVEIRGELLISNSDFEVLKTKIPNKITSPRNTVVTALNSKNKLIMQEYVSFLPFQKIIDNKSYKNVSDLAVYGFLKQESLRNTLEGIKSLITLIEDSQATYSDFFKNVDFNLDGLVITYLGKELQPITAVKPLATKYYNPIVEDVSWSLSHKRLDLTCTLHITPIEVEGKVYKKVYLKDFDLIRENKVMINKLISVKLENEALTFSGAVESTCSNAKTIDIPTLCPTCNKPLTYYKNRIACTNNGCADDLKKRFKNLSERMGFIKITREFIKNVIQEGAANEYEFCKKVFDANPENEHILAHRSEYLDIMAIDIPGFYLVEHCRILLTFLRAYGDPLDIGGLTYFVYKNYKGDDGYKFQKRFRNYIKYAEKNKDWLAKYLDLMRDTRAKVKPIIK